MAMSENSIKSFKLDFDSFDFRDSLVSNFDDPSISAKHCDVHIQVDNVNLYCHYNELSKLSPYFQCYKKYTSSSHLMKFTLNNIDPIIMQIILTYVYTHQIIVEPANMPDLIVVADYLLMESLLEAISDILTEYLTVDNVISYLHLSENIMSTDIKNKITRFIILNLYELNQNAQLNTVPYAQMKLIIQDDRIILKNATGFLFGSYFKSYLTQLTKDWIKSSVEVQNQDSICHELSNIIEQKVEIREINKVSKYRYSEPISRAYFMNSNPFGQHPPSLVGFPFNFRCLSRNIKRTFIDYSPNKWFVKKIIYYVIPDWHGVKAISDIDIEYKNCWTGEIKSYKSSSETCDSYQKQSFELMDTERITQMKIHHSWMIYGMELTTSFNRHTKVIGSRNGKCSNVDFLRDYPHALYFHGFAYLSVTSRGWPTMNWLTIYGAILDKEWFVKDFEVGFELMIMRNNCANKHPNGSFWSRVEENARKGIDDLDISGSVSASNLWLCEEKCGHENDEMPLICAEGLEMCGDDLTTHYPMPHTIDDLFYQWRKYMRLMRLSVISRPDSIFNSPPPNN